MLQNLLDFMWTLDGLDTILWNPQTFSQFSLVTVAQVWPSWWSDPEKWRLCRFYGAAISARCWPSSVSRGWWRWWWLFLSSACTWRFPITLLSSSWTWAGKWNGSDSWKRCFNTEKGTVLRLMNKERAVSIPAEAPTLYLWILGHEQEPPPQCNSCRIRASGKQIHDCVQKVLIVKVAVGNPRFLREEDESMQLLKAQSAAAILGCDTKRHRWSFCSGVSHVHKIIYLVLYIITSLCALRSADLVAKSVRYRNWYLTKNDFCSEWNYVLTQQKKTFSGLQKLCSFL